MPTTSALIAERDFFTSQPRLSISDVSSCRSLENAHHHRAEYIAEPGSQAANAALNVVKVPLSKLTGAS